MHLSMTKGVLSHSAAFVFCLLLLAPFSSCQHNAQAPLQAEPPNPSPGPVAAKRVAVIGAGSAGASTAYYLRHFTDFFSIPVNITVYERASYVGGRSTTVNAFDDPAHPIELGASIFVEVNKNLIQASKKFGLKLRDADSGQPKESLHSLGVWDGKEFAFLQTRQGIYWWNVFKLLYRYGWAPLKTQNLMKVTVNKFLKLYKFPYFPFQSLSDVAMSTGLAEATWTSGAEYLKDNGIAEQFSREVIQASTRVNYGQNLALIHGLETMVCMATDGAVAVEGGNWQIFQAMLNASKATVKLNSPVTSIELSDDNTYTVSYQDPDVIYQDTDDDDDGDESFSAEETFDHVVIANPYQFSNISLSPPLKRPLDAPRYVDLHVTLFASPHKLSPGYFNMPAGSSVPEVVLTTLPADVKLGARIDGVGPAQFWSISTLEKVPAPGSSRQDGISGDPHYIYKVFSPKPLKANFISGILGIDEARVLDSSNNDNDSNNETGYSAEQRIADIPMSHISWYYEKVWQSYPYLYPRVTFEDIKVAPNLWYTNGMESFISTMETSSLAGMNVAGLILSEWVSKFETKLKQYEDGVGG
ncbi:prenylcysteine oxidase/farnesylcysteine lyase [Blastomyces parvus]|uniref:Prenylcysteine oxidase/farnesylcysteine lyase n=1 Tax=Blastomyces parvus TaxID=2060905 RepID=A0A2B7WDA6_9EURO|nr:prenylcysteine oxidase/farnesylcysteine lyase [Blastomyces parvus]